MTLGVKLYTIFHHYQDQINLVLDIMFEMHYIMKDEYIRIQDVLNSEDYKKKYIEFMELVSRLEKSTDGTSVQLSEEHREIYDLQSQLARNIPKANHFMNMIHVYLMALFEGFNKQFFSTLFYHMPEQMKSRDKKINYEVLFNFKSIENLHKYISEKETDEFGRMDIDKFNKELAKRYSFQLNEEFEYWEDLREKYYRRNIIVHNNGKISEIYLNRMNLSSENLNRKLNCDIDYLIDTNNNLKNYMSFIFTKIKEKFNLDTSVKRQAPFPIDFGKPTLVKKAKDEKMNDEDKLSNKL